LIVEVGTLKIGIKFYKFRWGGSPLERESIKFKKYYSYAAVFLLLSALVFSGIAFRANAAGSAAVSYSISKSTVNVGDSFDINVNITDVSSLYGASIDFKYDSSLFTITEISEGSIFGTVNSGTPVNDTSSGLISFYCTLQGKVPGLSSTGTQTLFIIHAKALKGGSVNLQTIATNDTLSNTGNNVRIKLADSTDVTNPIKYTVVNKTLIVNGALPVSIGSISVDRSSPQIIGAKIKLTANAAGGAARLYRFSVLEGTTWKVVRDYSDSNTYTWAAAKAGTFKVKTEVKDGTTGKPVSKEISYTINSGISFSSFKTDKASPELAGSKIKLTSSASGSANLLYKFSAYDGTSWKTLKDYSSTNYYYWTPTKAVRYTIKAEVKDDSTGKLVSKTAYYTIYPNLVISSVKTSLASPQLVKAKINISAFASGGSSRLYKFRIHDGLTWRTVRDYSTYSTYSWTPARAAKHRIMVYVKDTATGTIVSKEISYYINSAVSISSLKTDKASPQKANTRIKLTASASGSANLLYKFSVYYGGYWRTLRNYSPTSYYFWTPTKATAYTVKVDVKDSATGKTAYKKISYKIN
jgi:N-acetylmuramoyl-L-alanine amidase